MPKSTEDIDINSAFDDTIRSLNRAKTRDRAVEIALRYMLAHCRRAAFFTINRAVVEGFAAAGERINPDLVKGVWIPLASPSTLREVCESKRPRIGPIGHTRTDGIFVSATGGRHGDAVMVPIVVADRVVSLIFGDDIRRVAPAQEVLEKLSVSLARTLAQILRHKRRDSF